MRPARSLVLTWLALAGAALAAEAPPRGGAKPPGGGAEPSGGGAKPPPVVRGEDDPGWEVTFDAGRTWFVIKDRIAVLAGDAWLESRVPGHGLVSLRAQFIVYFLESGVAYAEGDVRLTDAKSALWCERTVYNVKTQYGRAWNVRLAVRGTPGRGAGGRRVGLGEARTAGSGRADEGAEGETKILGGLAGALPEAWYLTAKEVRRDGPERWVAGRSTVTSCSFARPHWRLRASGANFLPGRRAEIFNAVLFAGPVPVFYLPYLLRDLAHDYPWMTASYGHSTEWGHTVLTKWGIDISPERPGLLAPDDLKLDLDWREERGFAYGLGLTYDALPRGGGEAEAYFTRETVLSREDDLERAADALERATAPFVLGDPRRRTDGALLEAARRAALGTDPPSYELDPHRDEDRWRVRAVHHQHFLVAKDPLWEERLPWYDLVAELHAESDRDFLHEYFSDEAKTEPLDSRVLLRRTTNADVLEIGVASRVNGFREQIEELPVARYVVNPRPWGWGIHSDLDLEFGEYRRRFDADSGLDGVESVRFHYRQNWDRPTPAGPFTLTPHLGLDTTWNSKTIDAGDHVLRAAVLYGGEAAARFTGVFPEARLPRLGVAGLRHVVEPRVRFDGVTDPNEDADALYGFDEADDIVRMRRLTMSLDQRLDGRVRAEDGSLSTRPLASLELDLGLYTSGEERRRLNADQMLEPLAAALVLRPEENLSLWSRAAYDLDRGRVERSAGGLTGALGPLGLTLSHRYIEEDDARDVPGSSLGAAELAWQATDRWRTSLYASYEFADESERAEEGHQRTRVALTRDLHCWELTVTYSIDELSDNDSVLVTLSPKARAREIVRASNELVVEPRTESRMPRLDPPPTTPPHPPAPDEQACTCPACRAAAAAAAGRKWESPFGLEEEESSWLTSPSIRAASTR